MHRASGVRRGRMAAAALGILAGAALVVVPAAPVAANPLCLDVLGLVELCLGGSPAAPPAPSEPNAPPSPDPSTPPEDPSEPPEQPESPEQPADPVVEEPSATPSPSAPVADGAPRTIAPASSGGGAVTVPAPEAAPTPVPTPTTTPAPAQERLADAGVPTIVIGDRGTPPAPGTVPMFAAGITLAGAGALAAGGILFARRQTDEPEAAPRQRTEA